MTSSLPAVPGERWQVAVDTLRAARDVTLVCHVAPDGDALGSMLGLASVLRAAGTPVTCTWGDERWAVPAAYRWLPGIESVVPPSAVVGTTPDVLVVLDTGSRDRLGVLAPVADRAGTLLVIDHHAHNRGLDGVHLVDASAASTTVLVEHLLRCLGADLDADAATCLYVGLVTDTGSFRHAVTTPDVHALAGRLLSAGVRPDDVARRLWGDQPFGYLQVLGAALSRLRLEPDAAVGRGVVWTWMSASDVAAAALTLDEVEPVIDVVRQAQEADVAVVLKQDIDDSWRISTRSRGATDVGAACAALGGGGHRLAAGFTSYDDVETTMHRIRAALDRAPAP